MKRLFLPRILAILIILSLLTACGSTDGNIQNEAAGQIPAPAATLHIKIPHKSVVKNEHTITERAYKTYVMDADTALTEPYSLFFLDGADDLPYVELYGWADMMEFLSDELRHDNGYKITVRSDGERVVYERENGYTMEFDFSESRIVFDDYDAFIHGSDDTALIEMVSESGFNSSGEAALFLRDRKASFDRYGDIKTVNLADYSINMIAQDGGYYVPLQTMNDLLVSPMLVSFLFNGEALFLANDEALFDYREGTYTELAEIYYEASAALRSDALAEYSYNELCLVLDLLYGLKEPHDIQSFHQFFWQIGYDEPLSSSSAQDADTALKSFIDFYLDDLHSVFNEYSYLAGLQTISESTGISNRKLEEHERKFKAARAGFYPEGCPGYEEVGNTAYITFDSFESDYIGEAFYGTLESGEIPDDTIGLIIYAHSRITREGSPIENVVLDLSNNTGGAVDAAVFVLGWILGDAPFSVKNMGTGAMSTAIYRVDTNLDRRFDEKDTISDKNVYCLVSPVSFSCGNSVPAALKSSQEVTLIGRTTGGGSCTVQPLSTAYGTVFQISGSYRISFLKNGSFYDIDKGVDPDYYLDDIDHFYDRSALTEFINNLY